MTPRPLTAAVALTAALLPAACTKSQKADNGNDTLPAKPVNETPIDAQHALATLSLAVDLSGNGMLLHVGNVPNGSTLECNLDTKALAPCEDGALLQTPAPGDHRITALARAGGKLTAQGASAIFTVDASSGSVGAGPQPLGGSLLVDADQSFADGSTEALSQPLTLKFHLDAQAPCQSPVMKCKYDTPASDFWTACDAGGGSFTVPQGLMAVGLQYLSVQASCGDSVGPTLTMSWWGVPDGFQPLMLADLADSNGRHFINLVKADDCPTSQQSFQCAPTPQDDFSLCQNGNIVDQPAAGYRVRLLCDGAQGPTLTIGG